ncbi:hypothetical protein [Nocardioides xinjiangensis]|uniref:hypothetical protein n=1 Tax=Nocardioides xinjiangensis TaxID=2817376 RepID=UPI001B303C17|nr:MULTISPECIES: hypothetical protein [unclassified Nocardioides]
MKNHTGDGSIDLSARITSLEQFRGSLVARPRTGAGHDDAPADDAPPSRVLRPRRARVFLRGGGGLGTFAELTVTAPRPRASAD